MRIDYYATTLGGGASGEQCKPVLFHKQVKRLIISCQFNLRAFKDFKQLQINTGYVFKDRSLFPV
jgi:hypothetical protein